MRNLLGLLGFLAACVVVAVLGGLASIDAASFYAQLQRPDWSPPAGAFGPVWTVLYTMIAIAGWWVWRSHGWRGAKGALTVYGAQLVVNALWSWLFFAWRLGFWALVDAALLWLLVAMTIVAFWRLKRGAALLLLPYLAWVSLATALTYSVWQRNPGLL